MDFARYTTPALLVFIETIRSCLAVDDMTPPGREKPYEVRSNRDWLLTADTIESELSRRKESFDPIYWEVVSGGA